MKRLVLLGALIALALPMPTAHAATTQLVGINDNAFRNGDCPTPNGSNTSTIDVGDTVQWNNCDPYTHNITWKTPGLTNRTIAANGSAEQIFSRAGFYDYYCSLHGSPTSESMQGRVVVRGAPSTTTTKVTAPAPTTTIATIPPTTTTSTTAPSIASTTSSSAPSETTTTTTTGDEQAIASKDGGASGGLVALLLLGVAAVVGGGFYVIQRMRAETGA